MFIQIDNENKITGYALDGSLSESIEFNGAIPEDFEENFKSSYYLLQNNEIVVNPNYEEPSIDIPTPEPSGPSPEMLAINALGVQVAKLMSEKGGV